MSNETGISLNQKCKELIDQFMEKEYQKDFTLRFNLKERITSLVEACIYADNHDPVGTIVTKELVSLDRDEYGKYCAEQAYKDPAMISFDDWWNEFKAKEDEKQT